MEYGLPGNGKTKTVDLKSLVLTVVPKKQPGEAVLRFPNPVRGDTPERVDYICGVCGELLVSGQVDGALIECLKCDALNRTPGADRR